MKLTTENFGEVILLTSPILVGATESIAFKTDVFESKNGNETRIPLKDKARQTLSFSSLDLREEIVKNFNVQWGGIRKNWAVPLAQESQYVGDVYGDFINCRTDIYSFYDGCLALLKNKSKSTLIEVLEVSEEGLLISGEEDIKDAKLYPVRVCFINGDIIRKVNNKYTNSSITFVVIDEPEVQESIPQQFLGHDAHQFCLMLDSGKLETAIIQNQNIINNEVGVIYQNSDWDHARYSKQYRTLINGHNELYEYRQFLFRCRGKYRQFWLPTYEVNMRVKSIGQISNVIQIEADQYKQLGDSRKHIAIKCDGIWFMHTISESSFISASTVQITISPSLNKSASSIQRISYLGLHRLDADSVDLNYIGSGKVEVSVPILEIGV